ncbi:hypothetical protein IWX90DRAFT_442076 [Phyllosticta citrichinensis]|uniref:Secreted protein n=1 Tax=Phyllosticta citrichinensis TaxID=1130410 RepID=A0ABR1XJN3_9PEZI
MMFPLPSFFTPCAALIALMRWLLGRVRALIRRLVCRELRFAGPLATELSTYTPSIACHPPTHVGWSVLMSEGGGGCCCEGHTGRPSGSPVCQTTLGSCVVVVAPTT